MSATKEQKKRAEQATIQHINNLCKYAGRITPELADQKTFDRFYDSILKRIVEREA